MFASEVQSSHASPVIETWSIRELRASTVINVVTLMQAMHQRPQLVEAV